LILAVMALRLAWRLTRPPPPLPEDLPRWQRLASRFVHNALYAALLAMPVAGWLWASSKGWPIVFFGAVALPPLIGAGSPLAHLAARAHRFLAWAILTLVLLHLVAVLYHVVIRRDDVALRMLPR
jgi:cytochrome b561